MVMTTVTGRDEAERLAEGILRNRLGACVQMADVRSVFLWQGKVQREDEVLLLVKGVGERYEELEDYIRSHHSYDVPEILRLPVTGGFSDYLAWLDSVTSPPPPAEL